MGAAVTPPQNVCREYATNHFAHRQSARMTREILEHLPWDGGQFELLGPTGSQLRPVRTQEELGWSQNPEPLPSSWLFPADVLVARLQEMHGRVGNWFVFDDGVSELDNIAEHRQICDIAAVPVGDGIVCAASAPLTDLQLKTLIEFFNSVWGLCLLIGSQPMPTEFDAATIRDRVETLVIIAHDGDAFLIWHRNE